MDFHLICSLPEILQQIFVNNVIGKREVDIELTKFFEENYLSFCNAS